MKNQVSVSAPAPGYSTPAANQMVLGTAQLGMAYGVANLTGQPNFEQALDLVRQAWGLGVRCFDTAQAYGESEAVLGRIFASLGIQREARVYSKLSADGQAGTPDVRRGIEDSLRRLGVPQLAGLFLHREEDLDGGLPAQLVGACHAGLVGKVGVSVYSASRALQALTMPEMELLQVAANVFDRRMQRAEVFTRAAGLGRTVFVRSVYLQGLVLQEPAAVSLAIPHARDAVRAYHEFCTKHDAEPRGFAYDHVRHMAPFAKLVIGAETVEQVRQNMSVCAAPPYDTELHAAWTRVWPEDSPALIDPRQWSTFKQQAVRQ